MKFFKTISKNFLSPRYKTAFSVAGGGCKTIYGLGVGCKLREWGVYFEELAGVSAGAAMILGLICETENKAMEYFEELVKRNQSNFKISNLLNGKVPFPHEDLYRRLIRFGLDFEKIKNSPSKIFIHAVKATPIIQKKEKLKYITKLVPITIKAFVLDELDREKGILPNRTKQLCEKWNFQEVVFTEKDLTSPEMIEKIILISSSIFPVLSFQDLNNEYYIDGGLTNNLLLEKFSPTVKKIGVYYHDTTLVGKDPRILKNSFLIRPSRKLPVTAFDYTNDKGIKEAFEMGKIDAENQKKQILQYLEN